MADVLPLRQYPVTTTQQIQPGVSRADIAQPYTELADTMKEFGSAAEETSKSLAEQAGAQAVTRNANGDIQVQKAPFIGPAAKVYERSVKMSALAEYDGDAQRTDIKLRTDFHDNPQGYLEAADKFAADMQKKVASSAAGPEVAVSLRRVIERTTTQTYRGLLGEKERLDLQRSDDTMKAGIASSRDDLMTLARGGVTSGPDWDAATDKYNTLIDQRVANPRLAYPQAQADLDRAQFHGELAAQGFLRTIDQTYKNAPSRAEGAAAALTKAQSILTDTSIKLSPQQREAYYHKAVGEVRANEAIRKQDMGEARLASQQLIMASSMGVQIAPEDVEGVAQMHIAAGDQAGAARLYATMARKPLNDDFGRQPLSEQTQQLSAVRGQAAAKSAYDFFTGRGYTPAQASGIVGNLIHESGLDPNSIGDAGTSVGLAQFHNERAAALAQFARASGRDPRDFQTQLEFIDKELHSTEGRALAALQAAATPEDAAAAFVHYERPKGYDQNNPSASMGFQSRVAQARAVYGGQGNVNINTPASALWLQANRARSLDTAARGQWKQVWEDYTKEGIRPPDKVVNDLINAARATGDHDLLEQIGAAGDRLATVQDAATRSLPEQEAQIAELHRQGSEGLLQAGQQGVMKDLERRYTAIQTGLKDNPIATTVANFGQRFKTPGPLNVQDPEQLAAGLAYRGRIAQFAAENWQTGAVPALDKADMAAVSGALASPDPAVKAGILQAITTALPEDVRAATLEKLGQQGHDQLVAVMAGGLMQGAPDVAKGILAGQQAKATDKGYLPHEGAEKATYTDKLAELLPASMFTEESRRNPTGSMAMIRGATESYYAFLRARAGKEDGKFDPDMLQAARDAVTGGVLERNGGKFIAPARGMSQGQADSALWNINEKDLAGVTTAAGEPITPEFLRSKAKLESVGDGRYGLLLGNDPNRPIYAYTGANTEMPQKYVLDLRGRPTNQPPLDLTRGINTTMAP